MCIEDTLEIRDIGLIWYICFFPELFYLLSYFLLFKSTFFPILSVALLDTDFPACLIGINRIINAAAIMKSNVPQLLI